MDDRVLQEFLKKVDKSAFKNEGFTKRVEKPWGYELIFTPEDLPYSSKVLHFDAGKRNSLQIHDKKIETGSLISGECDLLIESETGQMETIKMEKGTGYTMKLGQRHRYQAVTDCDVFESALPEIGTTYRFEDDYARGNETEQMRKDPNRGWNN